MATAGFIQDDAPVNSLPTSDPLPGKSNHHDGAMYAAVAAREIQVDATMWQVPTMSMTGQAFLLTIALASDSRGVARVIASALAVVVTILSLQLMARLRRLNIVYAEWLNEYESRYYGQSLHGAAFRDKLAEVSYGGPLASFRSFRLWVVGLSAFGMAGVSVLVLAASQSALLR